MTSDQKHIYLLRFKRFQQSREQFFAPKIHKALNEQYKTFIDNYKSQTDSTALLSISSEPIIKALQPLYLDAAIVFGAKIRADLIKQGRYTVQLIESSSPKPMVLKARMPIGFSEQMAGLIKDYFRTDILNTSEGITQTTRELIQIVLQDAYDKGFAIDEIIKLLENTELSRIRARMIARTETVTAANQGAMFAAKDTGLKLNKIWLAVHDKRTRHTHNFIDEHTVAFEDDFKLPSGVFMAQPGDRTQPNGLPTPASEIVNCRCTIVFVPVRDASGRLVRA